MSGEGWRRIPRKLAICTDQGSISRATRPLKRVYFDEMESFEHTKFKPLSIALCMARDRRIITAEGARMPAKGLLAARARKKYGFRPDESGARLAGPHTLC